MHNIKEKINFAFITSANHLGIKYESLLHKTENYKGAIGIIHNFGSKKGTIIFHIQSKIENEIITKLKYDGYFFSKLNDIYMEYNESLFIDTLNDWGYYGKETPGWYRGKPWS